VKCVEGWLGAKQRHLDAVFRERVLELIQGTVFLAEEDMAGS
jgi:hypothetical protein